MRPEINAGEIVPARIARAFEASLQSNVYAVLRLNRDLDGVRADRSIYVDEAVRFMARLAQRVRGKRVYGRLPHLKRFLPNAMSIEQLIEGPHFNLMIHRPDSWDFEAFEMALKEEWLKSPWASNDDERAIKIEARQPGSCLFGYCNKEGDEALIVETLRFATLCRGD
jgi:hypothetical protein